MDIERVRGCTCNSLTIDGREEVELTAREKSHVKALIYRFLTSIDLNEVLQMVLDVYGDTEFSEKPCETCGDYIETTTLKLKE